MNPAPLPPSVQTPSQAQAQAQARAEARAQRLARLADVAMGLAEATAAQAHTLLQSAENPAEIAEPLATLNRSFDHLSRTIRQTTALERKLDEPEKSLDIQAARHKILRGAEDMIELRAPAAKRENLLADLYERLDDPEFDEQLTNTDFETLITEVIRDLGVGPTVAENYGKPRAPAEVAALRLRAAPIARHKTGLANSKAQAFQTSDCRFNHPS
jgi:hypothetical protein